MDTNDFLAFWGWRNLPWTTPPRTDQLFWQRSSLDSIQKLLSYLKRPYGVSILEGPAGHGKSTLSRWLYQQFPVNTDDVATFRLSRDITEPGWLSAYFARYLGLSSSNLDSNLIYDKLFASRLRRRPLTVILDQAEKLNKAEAFADIQALLQSKASGSAPINFVLFIQNQQTNTNLPASNLQHLLHFQSALKYFDHQELAQFLHYYLKSISLSSQVLTPEAHKLFLERVTPTFSGVESLLSNALIESYLRQQSKIQADVILELVGKSVPAREIEDPAREAPKSAKAPPNKRGNAKNAAGSAAALDLNSLYYKSEGSEDPEDS